MSGLAQAGVRAAKWSAISTVARFALQLLAQVVLARLLGPDSYGVFGMGLVIFTFSNFLATFGFSWSLAQLREISDEDIRFAFTWQLLVGLVAGVALFFAAPLVADYFHDPRVLGIVRWMSAACVINAAGSVAGNLMRRNMNFRAIGMIQLASYAVGYLAVGIPMALAGAGVNALVAAWMAQALVVVVAGYVMCPHPIKPLLVGPQAREMVRIGTAVFFTNLINWFINNLDRLIIGRMLNAHAVGVYTAGYNLANMPNTLLLGALQPVFLAAGARVQDERTRLRNAYQQVIATVWVLLLPFFVFLAMIAPDVIKLLYGPAWSDAAPVMAVLFLAMPAYVTWGMSTPVLWNTGRAHQEMLLQLPLLPLAAGVFYVFASRGVFAAAAVAAFVLVLRGVVMGIAAFRVLGLRYRLCLGWLLRGVGLSLLVTAPVVAVTLFAPSSWHPLVRLTLDGAGAAILLSATLALFPRIIGHDAAAMLVRFAPKLQPWLVPSKATAGR